MTMQEYARVSYFLKNGWPGQFSQDNEAAYSEFLLKLPFAAVMASLHKLAGDGANFVPSVGAIVGAVGSLAESPVPSWSEAWAQIELAMRQGNTNGLDARVAAFVELEGLRKLQLAPLYEPERGEMRIHQLGQRFSEFCDVRKARENRSAALHAAGMVEVEQREPIALPESTNGGSA